MMTTPIVNEMKLTHSLTTRWQSISSSLKAITNCSARCLDDVLDYPTALNGWCQCGVSSYKVLELLLIRFSHYLWIQPAGNSEQQYILLSDGRGRKIHEYPHSGCG